MRRPRCPHALVPAIAAAAVAACGAESSPAPATGGRRAAIINGAACGAEQLPATVALVWEAQLAHAGQALSLRALTCTGTLIAPDVVLTAAHCVIGCPLPEELQVTDQRFYATFRPDLSLLAAAGADPSRLPALPDDAVAAAAWVSHPDFRPGPLPLGGAPGDGAGDADVGLVFLTHPVTHVTPAIVITAEEAAQIAVGRPVQIAGWGMQQQPLDHSGTDLAGADGTKQCATSFINTLGPREMQIGAGPDTARKCHGDSGGPTYMDVTTDLTRQQRVIGITSHAYEDTDCAEGSVDVRVDAFLGWIDAQLRLGCAAGQRSWCAVPGIVRPEPYARPPSPQADPEASATATPRAPTATSEAGGEATPLRDTGCALSQGRPPPRSLRLLLAVLLLALARRR